MWSWLEYPSLSAMLFARSIWSSWRRLFAAFSLIFHPQSAFRLKLLSDLIHSAVSCMAEQMYTNVLVRNTTFSVLNSFSRYIYGVHGNAACWLEAKMEPRGYISQAAVKFYVCKWMVQKFTGMICRCVCQGWANISRNARPILTQTGGGNRKCQCCRICLH